LRVYHHCFLGSEAVAWLIESLKISHEKAMGIGKRLIAEKWIHPLNNEHDFKDENVLYRFYVDEKSEPKQPDKQMLDTDKIKKLFSLS
jgi:Domain found in Dishevelled, Egl-10, and Pleckstrin (DEP)